MLFATVILTILWLLQIIFIDRYYQSMRIKDIEKAANTITSAYSNEDFEEVMRQLSFQKGLTVHVIDTEGHILFSADMMGSTQPRKPIDNIYDPAMYELAQSATGEIMHTISDPRFRDQSLIYGRILSDSTEDNIYLFIHASLIPIDSTIRILKNQLTYISIILILLAFLISFYISRRLSKPITRITESASELAKGNYNVVFDKGEYSEVNFLSDTLNYATKELAKTESLRRELIANISHDLRTPLTMVKAYAEMVRDLSGDNPTKRTAHLKVIIDEADRLSTLVNDILDLSKIQSGTTTLNVVEFDLTKTVNQVLQRFHVFAERDGYTFHLNLSNQANVKGDKQRIEQVVYNLISNAINYSSEDKHITINIQELENSVRFEVIDSGIGIPKEELPYIWDRYYKVKENHKRAIVGTGLGLSIIKSILLMHNASFGVDSKVGAGSTFWFELKK